MSDSSPRVIRIENEQAAFDLLENLLNNQIDAENVELDLAGADWLNFELGLTGREYHSTINTDLMSALVEYQNTLFRVTAYLEKNQLHAGALTQDVRERLRLNFKVEEGSSQITADLVKAAGEFAGRITRGMGPTQRLILILTTLLLLAGYFTVPGWIEKHYKAREAELKTQEHKEDMETVRAALEGNAAAMRSAVEHARIMQQAIQQQPRLGEVRKQAENATNEIIRQSADADTVRFRRVTLPGPAVRALTGRRRRSGEDAQLGGTFRVEVADTSGEAGFICRVRRISDGLVVQATMTDAIMADRDQKVIQDAFWSRKPVQLNLSGRMVGNDFRNARITSARATEEGND